MIAQRRSLIILAAIGALVACGGEAPDEGSEQEQQYKPFSGRMSATQVAVYAKQAGIPCGERLRVAVAVAYAESGYNPSAKNVNTNGTVDQGLWQINTYWHPPSCNYYDPQCNAAAMASISSRGTNWQPWYGHGTSNYWTAYNSHARDGAQKACDGTSDLAAPFLFDAGFYLKRYPDLKAAFGSDHAAARHHWETYGIREGRQASPGFSVRNYLARHADLRAAYGNNYKAAIQHWLKYGIKEGRRTSRAFAVRHYLARYADLRAAFGGENYKAAIRHWLEHGIKEGRQSANNFSVRAYLARYADLRAAFGQNYRAALIHWYRYGAREGRNPAP